MVVVVSRPFAFPCLGFSGEIVPCWARGFSSSVGFGLDTMFMCA